MAQALRCLSCGGVYSPTTNDGLLYFHACAPLPPVGFGPQAEVANKRDENLVLDVTRVILITGVVVGVGAIPIGVPVKGFASVAKLAGAGTAISATPPILPA